MDFFKFDKQIIDKQTSLLLNLNSLHIIFTDGNITTNIENSLNCSDNYTVICLNGIPKVMITPEFECELYILSINSNTITDLTLYDFNPNMAEYNNKVFSINDNEYILLMHYINLIEMENKTCTSLNKPIIIIPLINSFLNHLQVYINTINIGYSEKENTSLSKIDITEKIKMYIDINYTNNINLTIISNIFFLNSSYISRIFTEHYNIGISNYITKLRISKAKKLLVSTNHLITYIASDCGFNSVCNFNISFKKETLISPSKFRKIHKNNN